jgi:GGDEF domain-containing protein
VAQARRPHDIAGRLGGDELALFLPGLADVGTAMRRADDVATAITSPIATSVGSLAVGSRDPLRPGYRQVFSSPCSPTRGRPSAKRPGANGARSTVAAAPSRISSAIPRPTAGAVLKPVPLWPQSR